MKPWSDIVRCDFAVPSGLDPWESAGRLLEMLRSRDPVERDEYAYSILAVWIGRGVLSGPRLADMGDRLVDRFDDSEVQSRTFAPLVLASLVAAGTVRPCWFTSFARWYATEADTRGYDSERGWLHAVAHGADLLGVFGLRDEVDAADLLELAAHRMTAETGHVWRDQEDDRLAIAMARTLSRPSITESAATGWMGVVEEFFSTGRPGPVPAAASNTMRTLRMLYILVDRGVRIDGEPVRPPHRDVLSHRLGELLAMVCPASGLLVCRGLNGLDDIVDTADQLERFARQRRRVEDGEEHGRDVVAGDLAASGRLR